jgi:gamma-glutamyltranspeptidase/glutathione hydrolase
MRMRSLHLPGRSPVYGRRAMCATSHPAASLAAIGVLQQGGNAVDAAIAAAAVLAVVECPMTGIGGDCFAILGKPGSKPIALNAAGRAPAAASERFFAQEGIARIETTSAHAVTVPGAVDGWCRLLADHGTMPLATLLAPAIELAERGFAVAPRVSVDWSRAAAKLARHAGARRNLLKAGRPPGVGEIMRLPALAGTLRRIAAEGRDGFYRGPVARDMVAELKALGGLHTLEDFAIQTSHYVEPISQAYGDLELCELPPSNQGIVALMLLKMLGRVGAPARDPISARRYHVLIEAARLAYTARDTFLADPDMVEVPIRHLLSDGLIDALVDRIDRRRRTPLLHLPEPAGCDTVCFAIVDEQGMALSFINSLFADFGSGICTAKSGVNFHNRGESFRLDAAHPNCIAPGKRPLHTLVPALALRKGRVVMAFGVMGAHFQPIGHAYIMSNLVDYAMDHQEAIDCPRVFFEGGDTVVEEGVPETTLAGLKKLGHRIRRRELPWGGAQIVAIDRDNGVLIGASDARKDGMALGY